MITQLRTSELHFGPMSRSIVALVFMASIVSPALGQRLRTVTKRLQHDERRRSYLLFVPSSYSMEEPMPLVFVLHGGSFSASHAVSQSEMNLVAEENGFLVAYPNARSFNWFNGDDNIDFIANAVLPDIQTQYAVDPTRVYSTGWSQGGVMSYGLAATWPDRFAAVASVSGVPRPEHQIKPQENPFPVLHIHGTRDRIGPYDGGIGEFGGPDRPPVPDFVDQLAATNGCLDSNTTRLPDINMHEYQSPRREFSTTVDVITYTSCLTYSDSEGAMRPREAVLYRVNGMAHSWPGDEDQDRSNPWIWPGNFDFEASEAIWEFFERHRVAASVNPLQAGDADQDLDFDQFDLVQVQIAAKYLTGQAATWGEGDWNGAPGGSQNNPPVGDGMFNQLDIVAAQQAGAYLAGPYAAIGPAGQENDGQTSLGYDANTGQLWVDAPAGMELTSINIDSASGVFTGAAAQNLGGSFDNDAEGNIFKATFGGSFGSLSFGNVAQAGLSEEFVLGDLTVVGSLAGGGDLGSVDLVYVPEPASACLLAIGLVVALTHLRHNTCRV